MNSAPVDDLEPFGSDRWEEVGAGESHARVFARVDGLQYAKLVARSRVADLIAERDRCEWASANGIPGPAVQSWQTGASGARLITSAVTGISANRVDGKRARSVWLNIIDAVRNLHQTDPAGCPFDRGVDQMFSLARDVVSRGAVNRDFLRLEQLSSTPSELLGDLSRELPLRLSQELVDRVVCHGDLTLPNIMVDPETLEVVGFVDLGRLGLADRHADLALLLANAQDTWPEHAAVLAETLLTRYGHPIDTDRLKFHLHLDPLTWD